MKVVGLNGKNVMASETAIEQSRQLDVSRHWSKVVFAVELFLGIIWIWSGLIHLSNPFAFVQAVDGYRLSSESVTIGVAVFLPWLQLVVGISLTVGIFQRGVRLCSAIMFQTLAIIQFVAFVHGIETSCGCFGDSGSKISLFSIGLTQSLALISWIIMSTQRHTKTAPRIA